ncbi:MAG: CHAT domain-containing protein [Acidobacteria bacterium]|nr:MAG: CHAT domain-containing protein [Acidobacteriota bacterium]
MKEIKRLCKTIERLVHDKAWGKALTAAEKLWLTSRNTEIADPELRVTYARALLKAAHLFLQFQGGPAPYVVTQVLRRAYDFAADEDQPDLSVASVREAAAYQLGRLYEEAKCRQSAVFWFRRALALARTRQVSDRILLNLYGMAYNLEPLARHDECRSCYDEILMLLWPTTERSLLLGRLRYLLPAAMYHLYHGDQQVAESVLRGLQTLLSSGREELPPFFAGGLYGLARHYLDSGRLDDAIPLAHLMMTNAERFGDFASELRYLAHGLIARVALLRGDFEDALTEIGNVFDLNPAVQVAYGPGMFVDNLELWLDVARIRAHRADFIGAAAAYETLAQALGTYSADSENGKTARARLAWVRQQADVVHELVSVWLTIDDPSARQAIDLKVANALLQLKANLFLAAQGNRLVTFRDYEGADKPLFDANRRFAAAARRVAAEPEALDSKLDLEDALFAREQIESQMVANAWEMLPALAKIFHFDFRDLQSVKYGKRTLLDYSLVEVRPPKRGLPGPTLGRRYVGVRLSSDGVKVVDLGSEEQVDALTVAFISEAARRPVEPLLSITAERDLSDQRHFTTHAHTRGTRQSLSALADRVYRQIVEPLEPLGKSVVIAPDGSLAGLPFHALVRSRRYLIEDFDLVYCHSLLVREALAFRQRTPGMQISIDTAGVNRDIVLLGNPEYSDASAAPLPGTGVEVDQIAGLLIGQGWSENEIHRSVGPAATVSRVAAVNHPRILHLAAHGSYLPAPTVPVSEPPPPNRYSWRRLDDMASAPLSDLDRALLRAVLVLSPQPESHDDPAAGRLLTALELSSLNLIACRLAAFSACETGIGQAERGAGVLGFQYALTVSFAHAGLVSLWSVPDRETSDLMSSFYSRLIDEQGEVEGAYLATLRKACRRRRQLVHPYYWAAFVLLV